MTTHPHALLSNLGERVRLARMRRSLTAQNVAEGAGVSRQTLSKVERGNDSVAIGVYFRVLAVLGLESDFAKVATDDEVRYNNDTTRLDRRRRVRLPKQGCLAVVYPHHIRPLFEIGDVRMNGIAVSALLHRRMHGV